MTPLDQTISEFGRSLGMTDLRPADNGSVSLDMANIGRLVIELTGTSQDAACVSLIRRIQPPDTAGSTRILELAHYRQPGPWPVRAGLSQGRSALVFSVQLDPSDLTLPALHEIIALLDGAHQAASTAVRSA